MPQFHLRHSYLSFSFPGIMNMIMLKPIALSNQDSWTPCYWLETRFHSICLRKEYWSYFKAYFEGLLAFMNMHCQGHSPQINGLGRPHLAAVGVLLIPNGRWRWLLCLLLPVCFSAVTKPLHPSPDLISQWKYPLPWSMVRGEQANLTHSLQQQAWPTTPSSAEEAAASNPSWEGGRVGRWGERDSHFGEREKERPPE